MDDDSHVIDKGWDALPDYTKSGDADDAVTVSISTTPGEWLVNTSESVVVPMSMAEVVEGLRAHKLNQRSLVWRAGMQEWAPIDKVPQLKLAARLPVETPTGPPASVAPPAAAPSSAPSASEASPGRPASKTPPPRHSAQPVGLSRRSTLPFGLPNPNAAVAGSSGVARPSQPRLSSPVAAPPPPPSEEPGVLAVYARPAATISFDLSPSEPARVPASAPPPVPQTLAPTTTDTQRPRSASPPAAADLSVVAASHFRAEVRSSKRRIWVSSLASAGAASLLTLWLSGALPFARPKVSGAQGPSPAAAALTRAQPVAAPLAAAAPVPAPVSEAPAPTPTVSSAPVATAPATPSAAPPAPLAAAAKPVARKPRAVRAAPTPTPAPTTGSDVTAAARQPSAEPNPYDVKLDEAAGAQPASKPATRGLLDMMQESEQKPAEPKQPEASAATGSSAPGF